VKRLPLLVVLGILLIALGIPIVGGQLGLGDAGLSPGPTTGAEAPGAPTEPASTEPPAAPAPTPTPTPEPTPVAVNDVAIVPVTQFRTTRATTNRAEVEAVLDGSSGRYDALALVESEADAVLAALGMARPADPAVLVLHPDAAALAESLAEERTHLGFLRADAVGPGVRALGWGSDTLFGVDRITEAGAWPLTISVPEDVGPADEFDPGATWTLFAGGDILLDRGVYKAVRVDRKNEDFLFDGGTAEITGRTCCSQFGHKVPTARRTGNKGAMRELMTKADLSIANLENPTPDRFRWHTSGTVFSGDPSILPALKRAGIDWVSLANNHIGDAGRNGIIQTMRNLDEVGIAHGGAGRNLEEARRPSIIEVNGVSVAILAYDRIARYYFAGEDRTGSAPLETKYVREDIAAARDAGADVVIVFPHWGAEYRATPGNQQQAQARKIIEAGADMIIGNHAHWAAALEIHEGKPIWYALGNFVFDQVWSEPTMQGMTLELTFHGADLIQAKMRPHIILDRAQPNFMDEDGDGRIVMRQVYDASKGLLPW
jgi:poly-gamma-glutamate capsule biosynthesis protein CapA/YwtB (metallophosphatase superfamily)